MSYINRKGSELPDNFKQLALSCIERCGYPDASLNVSLNVAFRWVDTLEGAEFWRICSHGTEEELLKLYMTHYPNPALKDIYPEELKQLALQRRKEQHPNIKNEDIPLMGAFAFNNTPEGNAFWWFVADGNVKELLKHPSFPCCERLRPEPQIIDNYEIF